MGAVNCGAASGRPFFLTMKELSHQPACLKACELFTLEA